MSKRKIVETTNNEDILENNKSIQEKVPKNVKNLDDYELNNLEYEDAINYDDRTFVKIYISILKRENIIIFTFYCWNDYNIVYIKFARFIFFLCTVMAMNVFFFFDNSLHIIYLNKGKYNLGVLFSQMICSTILIIFFIYSCILSAFYWYLISSFCAVYENTQTIFLINFFLTFIIFLIY